MTYDAIVKIIIPLLYRFTVCRVEKTPDTKHWKMIKITFVVGRSISVGFYKSDSKILIKCHLKKLGIYYTYYIIYNASRLCHIFWLIKIKYRAMVQFFFLSIHTFICVIFYKHEVKIDNLET